MKGNTPHSNVPKIKKAASSASKYNYSSTFQHANLAFAFTTLAPKNFLLKYCCCLSVAFSLHDFNSHGNLGKAVSPIVTNGISPKLPRSTFRSGITRPPIISLYIKLILTNAHRGCCRELQQQHIKTVCSDLQAQNY